MCDPWVLWSIVALALIFDYINGFHDAANSIATIVSTRVLSPRNAVIWAAFFNFIALFFFGLHVAKTIGKGTVHPAAITLPVITAGLIGAITWNLITWWRGIPSSSSHALVGGFAGAAFIHGGTDALVLSGIVKILAFIFVAPILGMVLGFALMIATYWTVYRMPPTKVSRWFRRLQLVSAAAYSLGHGANDAQKTMGIVMAALIVGGRMPANVDTPPIWVIVSCYVAMGLGTLMGGWRIVKTMGQKICKLQPVHGFAAESAGALTLYGTAALGIPVSTTHTITGSILGVGSTRGIHAVKWGVATRVVWAWVFTIPASAAVSALFWFVFTALGWH